jgi:methionyl-tRNA formyltransferase
MKILFMGTPEIAAEPLKVISREHEICAVVTRIDKPNSRGNKLIPSPVKLFAQEAGIKLYQPKSLKQGFIDEIKILEPDIIIVVAFGMILPTDILNYSKYGAINLHASTLPKYRGAAPIQRAIESGEVSIGLTVMQMDKGIDTGDMLLNREFPITPDETFGDIYERLCAGGGELLLEALDKIESGTIIPQKQNDALSTYADKIEKSELKIDFAQSAETILNKIRSTSPYLPRYGIYTRGDDFSSKTMLKFIRAKVSNSDSDAAVGTITALSDKGSGSITIKCVKGQIDLLSVTPEGKSTMNAGDFVRGRKIAIGDRFI